MTDDLERRRREDSRNRENQARFAFAYAEYESKGLGSEQFDDGVEFGLTFIEQPYVTTGHLIDVDAIAEAFALEGDVTEVPLPHVSSYVADWDRDDRGFYIGAFCVCVVTFAPDVVVPVDIEVNIKHHFTFSAIALKDVPIGDLTI